MNHEDILREVLKASEDRLADRRKFIKVASTSTMARTKISRDERSNADP